jgi:hypothetical protein
MFEFINLISFDALGNFAWATNMLLGLALFIGAFLVLVAGLAEVPDVEVATSVEVEVDLDANFWQQLDDAMEVVGEDVQEYILVLAAGSLELVAVGPTPATPAAPKKALPAFSWKQPVMA